MEIRLIKLLNLLVIFTFTIDSAFTSLSGSGKRESYEELACIVSIVSIFSLLLVIVGCINWKDLRIFKRFKFNNLECIHQNENVIQFPDTFNPDRSVAFDVLPDLQVSIPGSPMDILEKYFFPKIYTEKNLTRIDVEKEVEILMKTLKSKYHIERLNVEISKEMGKGWFGPVMKGCVREGNRSSRCVVSALNELAAPSQVLNYFKETAAYREMKHANVLRMMHANIDTIPFWTVLEFCHLGDLKTYLVAHRIAKESIIQKGLLIRFAIDMAMGLNAIHDHKYVHRDFAIRNCLVCSDLTIKVGDYGIAIEKFKADYFEWGGFFIPLRWLAPETYHHADEIFKLRKMTMLANIWSLGVSMWELISFGVLPYPDFSNEELLEQHKLGNLKQFFKNDQHRTTEKLAKVMGICLVSASKRPTLQIIINQLLILKNETTSDDVTLMKDTLSNCGSPCEFLDVEDAFAAESVINENFNFDSIALSFEPASDDDFDVGLQNELSSAIELKRGIGTFEIGGGFHKTTSFDEGRNVSDDNKFHESVKSYYEDLLKKHHGKMFRSDPNHQRGSRDVIEKEIIDEPGDIQMSGVQTLQEIENQDVEVMLSESFDIEPNRMIIVMEPGDIHNRGDEVGLGIDDEPRCHSRLSHCSNSDSKIVNIEENSLTNINNFSTLHSTASHSETDEPRLDKNTKEISLEITEDKIIPVDFERNLEIEKCDVRTKEEDLKKLITSDKFTNYFNIDCEVLNIDPANDVADDDNFEEIISSNEIEPTETPSVLENISFENNGLDRQSVVACGLEFPSFGFEDNFTIPLIETKDATHQEQMQDI